MIKRTFKRTLSIVLTLVLLATTFFIFDPSTLKMDANAWVDTEANSQGSSIAKQIANAPETIYLKPGAANFQYFSLLDVEKGKAADSKATSGHVTFSNPDASNVKLYVNNFWKRNSLSGTADGNYTEVAASDLKLNLNQNITKAGVTATSTSVASGATVLKSATTGSLDAEITSASYLNGYEEGGVYIIEWVISYDIKGTTRFEFLYTGIYAPKLQLTGVTGSAKHTGSMGNEPAASGFLFVTGAMNYATVGNRSHAFIKKASDFAANATVRPYLAPLIGFMGQKNNGTNYTVPSVSSGYNSTANFPTTGTKTVMVTGHTSQESNNFLFYTTYSSWGSYATPSGIAGSNHADVGRTGMTTAGVYSGIAYEVVDTSRFTDYSQIPNFSVGYVRYYAKRGGEYAYLDYIRLQRNDAHYNTASLGVQAAVDRSEFDEDDDNARTWGLHTLNGPIQAGNTYVCSHYRQDLSGFDRECNIYFGIGLVTTAVDKANIRSAYCEGLQSNIDRVNDSAGFSSYYTNMKAQARILCDPTATVNTVSISKDTVASKQKEIVKNNTAAVYKFYVPEVIYLKPGSSLTASMNTFQYYVDRENSDDGALRTGENTSGNIYFKCNNPDAKVTGLTCADASVTVGATTSTNNVLSTTVTAGTLNTAIAPSSNCITDVNTTTKTPENKSSKKLIKWTLTYDIDGARYTAINYSVVYAPYLISVANGYATRNSSGKEASVGGILWISGMHGFVRKKYDSGEDAYGGMNYQPMITTTIDSKSIGYDPSNNAGSYLTWNGNGQGYGGYYNKSNSNGSHTGSTSGWITVDSSRYSTYNIPNVKFGLDYMGQRWYYGNRYQNMRLNYGVKDSSTLTEVYSKSYSNSSDSWAGTIQGGGTRNGSVDWRKYHQITNSTTMPVSSATKMLKGWINIGDSDHGVQATSYLYFDTILVNKAELRTILLQELETGKQQQYYTSGSWSTYISKIGAAATVLGDPEATATEVTNAKNSVGGAAAGLVKNTGTATVNHVKSTGGTLQTAETKTYEYGDTVYAGSNDFTGYTLTSAVRSAPTSKTLTINTVEDDPDGNDATDEIKNCTSANCTWTFTYTPNKYDVTYIPDGGTFNGQTGNKTYADIVTYDANFNVGAVANGGTAAANPTKTGYDFKGWKFNLDGETYKDPANTSSPTAINPWNYDTDTAAFTALWTPHKYNIEFDGNTATGGSTQTMTDVVYDTSVSLTPNGFVKTGYEFDGWATSATGAKVYDDEAEVSNLTATNNATVKLYAKWTPKTFTATAKSYSNTASAATTWSNNATGGSVKVNSATAGATSSASVSYGTTYTLTAGTPNTGYYFVGWYSAAPTSANTTSARVTTTATYRPTMSNADKTYYARYDIEQYTIYFNKNTSATDTANQATLTNVKYGTTQTVSNPTRTGYTFGGWYAERACTNQVYGTTGTITVKDHGNNNDEVTVYAKWTANTINVVYNANGGSGTNPGTHSFAYGSAVTVKNNTFTAPATRTVTFDATGGTCTTASLPSTFTFTKWNGKADGTGAGYDQNTEYTITTVSSGTLNLYAQWTQSAVTLPTPTKTGHTFAGWYTASSGGTRVGGAGSSYTPAAATTTLYAQWTVDSHDVNVYAYYNIITSTSSWRSGTTGGTVTGAGSYNYGASYSVTATASTGYKFVGWYSAAPTSANTTSARITTNATLTRTMGTSNVTYYARFDIVYCTVYARAYRNTFANQESWAYSATGGKVKVAGDTTGTEAAISSGKVITGNSATLTATPATGYHFVGWYTAAPTSGTTWGTAVGTSTTLTVDYNASGASRYARFDVNANSLTVNPNGGSAQVGTETITASKTYTRQGGTTLAVYKPTRTGYTFASWTKSTTFNGSITSTTADATYTFANNTYGKTDTITATWTANKYTIAFDKNDAAATGTMSNMTNCAYDTSYTLTANAFTKTGYTFAGWATSDTGAKVYDDEEEVSNLTATDGATVTLYATWTVNNYKLDLNGKLDGTTGGNITGYGKADVYVNGTLKGNQVADFYQDVPYGATYEIKNITAETGRYYVGVASGSLTGTMPANNVSVYLEFATEQYTINFYKNDGTSATHSVLSNVKYGTSQSVTVPTRTGYTFNGWYDAATGGNQFLNATTTTFTVADYGDNNAVKNYYAQWTINQYTIKAYAMTEGTNGAFTNSATGGTVKINSTAAGATASVTVDYNTALTYTRTPATGYVFSGWFSDSAYTTAATPISSATANKTYYAKFTIAKYTLTLKGYGNSAASTGTYSAGVGGTVKIGSGTAGATATSSINYNGTATITATPATGYKFDGWYKTVTTGSGDTVTGWSNQYTGTSCEAMTANRTYYAKFSIKSVTVTYNANGGTNGSITSATVYYGQSLTIGATPTRTGYKLLGWAESSTATTADYTTTVSATTINNWIAAGTTKIIYAVWKEYQYDVQLFAAFNTASATNTYKIGTTGGTVAYRSGVTTIKTGEDIISKLTITPATGYEFVEVKYRVVDSFPSSGSAVTPSTSPWSGAYSTSNASYKTMPEFADGSKVAVVAYFRIRQFNAMAYAYSNSTTGGYTNNAAGGTVKCGSTGTPGATAQKTAYFGNSSSAKFYATPNTGYTFVGWFKDAALSVSAGTASSITVTIADDSTNANINKRYAKFSINTHNAYARAKYYEDGFDSATGAGLNGINGGTVTVSTSTTNKATTTNGNAVSVVAKYSEHVTYSATAATGYEFAGWYLSTDATDNENIEEADALDIDETYVIIMPDADIRIHAKFVPYNFIVTLNPNGGTSGSIAEVTLTYNQGVTLTAESKPIRSSHNFAGWAESPVAATATYTYTDNSCIISKDDVNRWFSLLAENEDHYEIYAVWTTATYIVTFDDQGGSGGPTSVEVTLGVAMPRITNIPTYEGYKFMGYYSEPGGADESTKYYNVDGASAKNWDIADGAKLYAKWVCPVLKDATYNKNTGMWTYIYEGANGEDVTTAPTTETLTKQGITDKAPTGAKEVTSIETTSVQPVKDRIKATEVINLNHYTAVALDQLLDNVTKTNTDLKRDKLTQVELNEYVAKLARYTDINVAGNKDTTETIKPSIKLYETSEKIKAVKNNTLTKSESVIGENYGKPSSDEGSSYIYTDKYSYYKNAAVDYYIYTNSRTPVIALEIDDGTVGTTAAENRASYPTNATVREECNDSIVSNKGNSVMSSAVPATNDINSAWFSKYTKANIGGGYDYNAKEIVYLTPTFTSTTETSTSTEIVYTITPKDDAFNKNSGLTKAEIAEIPTMQADKFASYTSEQGEADSITVCVCYHNTMNGTSDEGGTAGEPYFQMYIDQPASDGAYYDVWLNQMHLYRQSGGANNWEIVMANESVYPVQDDTFKDTGYVLGSFAYIFDSTNEPIAASYAEAGNYAAAKDAVIRSIKSTASEKQQGILNTSHSEHLKNGLGLFGIAGWSSNFYPKKGAYVYAHLVDRWGNIFNKVWKCFNVEDYTPIITGKVSTGFNVTEDGGSNLAAITIDGADISFLTDLDSTFDENVFTSSGNVFTVSTGKPKAKLPMVVKDKAGNELKGNIPTDENGNIKFTIEDLCKDLSSGAYTFDFNGIEVNLWARDPAIVRSAEMAAVTMLGDMVKLTVKTMDNAAKVQIAENGQTRTFTPDMSNVDVVDNGDGILTWNINVNPLALGEHSFEIKCKDKAGKWHDSDITVATNVVNKPVEKDTITLSVRNTTCLVAERAVLMLETNEGTQAVRVMYENGYSTTIRRESASIEAAADGKEIWTVKAGAFNAEGEYTASAYIMYKDKWQKADTATFTITVKEPVKEGAAILTVILPEEVKVGESADIEIITNANTAKIQFVFNNDTMTYTSANAQVTDNGDGTLTWTINRIFKTFGENEIMLKAKSSLGWTEAESFGIVTVK